MAETAALYQPLDSAQGQFRVLRVLGLRDGVPNCELRTASVKSKDPAWNALSYQWSDVEATESIIVNETDFAVRPNLYEFLLQLARDQEQAWFFADAICINQTELAERSAQVRLMGEIYRNAQKVIAWISPDLDDRWEQALVKNLAASAEPSQIDSPNLEAAELARSIENRETTQGTSQPDIAMMVAAAVTMNSFWSRLWIVQEVILASQIEFWYTNYKVSEALMTGPMLLDVKNLEVFDYLPKRFFAHETESPPSTAERDQMHFVMASKILVARKTRRLNRQAGNLIPFYRAAILSSKQNCQKLHDRAFGILGITESSFSVDYDTPLTELFIDMFVNAMLSIQFDSASRLLANRDIYRIIGHTLDSLARAFELSSRNPFVMLVLHEVAAYFLADFDGDTHRSCHRAVAIFGALRPDLLRGKYPRRWYETRRAAEARFWREAKTRADALFHQLADAYIANEEIPAPWPAAAGGEAEVRTFRDWAHYIRLRCEAVEKRFPQEEPAPLEQGPAS